MPKVLISTTPFGEHDPIPLKLLETAGIEYCVNPYGRRLSEEELFHMVPGFDAIIAGTEPITSRVMAASGNKLKLISRVGIGLDSVDLVAAKRQGVSVSYTPDAPAPAVAELTIGLILSLLRSTHICNLEMHHGKWQRFFGRRISEVTYGVIGAGRIGSKVIKLLRGLGAHRILVNDIQQNLDLTDDPNVIRASKEEIYQYSDVVTLHVPLTQATRNMVTKKELCAMQDDALIVNTSRGGIINEQDLLVALKEGYLAGAAVDVFAAEPYHGPLIEIDNCLLTSHMGSMSVDCRRQMELDATDEVVRFFRGSARKSEVPYQEYEAQRIEVGI